MPPGYSRFGGVNSTVVVPDSWVSKMKIATKKKKASCSVKKYIDGFFNPWDLQALNTTIIEELPDPTKGIFEALEGTTTYNLYSYVVAVSQNMCIPNKAVLIFMLLLSTDAGRQKQLTCTCVCPSVRIVKVFLIPLCS